MATLATGAEVAVEDITVTFASVLCELKFTCDLRIFAA